MKCRRNNEAPRVHAGLLFARGSYQGWCRAGLGAGVVGGTVAGGGGRRRAFFCPLRRQSHATKQTSAKASPISMASARWTKSFTEAPPGVTRRTTPANKNSGIEKTALLRYSPRAGASRRRQCPLMQYIGPGRRLIDRVPGCSGLNLAASRCFGKLIVPRILRQVSNMMGEPDRL